MGSRSASNGMKILMISKYPPIEGGVSSRNYWLAKALGDRGIEVSVITNALACEEEWRAGLDMGDVASLKMHQPKNVFFYSLKDEPPFHIPYSQGYLSRLVNLGLKVIGERGADVIYSHYLEPYAAAGFILKKITGLPLVIRHAGSDIYRIYKDKDYRYFMSEVIRGADALLYSSVFDEMSSLLKLDRKKLIRPPYGILDHSVFSPEGEKFNFDKYGVKTPHGIPIVAYLGKSTANKGIEEAINALSGLKQDFRFVFVSGGGGSEHFMSRAKNKLAGKFIHLPFIPPWEVPALMRFSAAVLNLENKFPIPIHGPIQPYEAIATGVPLILSGEMFGKIAPLFPGTASKFTVVENPQETDKLLTAFQKLFSDSKQSREDAKKIREEFLTRNHWEKYVDFHISLFHSLC